MTNDLNMINNDQNSYIDDWVFFFSSEDQLWHAALRVNLRKANKSDKYTLTTYTSSSLQMLVEYVQGQIIKKTDNTDIN